MLFWTVQITVISIVLIFLVHHLFLFFKSTLTVPKIKDLVHAPAQKYEEIYHTISSTSATSSALHSNTTTAALLPAEEITSMKDELKNFLKSKSSSTGSTPISSLDSFSSQNFAQF